MPRETDVYEPTTKLYIVVYQYAQCDRFGSDRTELLV